jgi:hypothetical protein
MRLRPRQQDETTSCCSTPSWIRGSAPGTVLSSMPLGPSGRAHATCGPVGKAKSSPSSRPAVSGEAPQHGRDRGKLSAVLAIPTAPSAPSPPVAAGGAERASNHHGQWPHHARRLCHIKRCNAELALPLRQCGSVDQYVCSLSPVSLGAAQSCRLLTTASLCQSPERRCIMGLEGEKVNCHAGLLSVGSEPCLIRLLLHPLTGENRGSGADSSTRASHTSPYSMSLPHTCAIYGTIPPWRPTPQLMRCNTLTRNWLACPALRTMSTSDIVPGGRACLLASPSLVRHKLETLHTLTERP